VFSPDPSVGYDTRSWTLQNATGLTLVGYADANGAKAPLKYLVAKGAPIIASNGRTYTWTVRTGYKFSDGSFVTAKSYARSIERILSACSYAGGWGSANGFEKDIVGGVSFHGG